MLRRQIATIVLLLLAFHATAQSPKTAPAASQKKTANQKLAKLAEPWPDAATLDQRRQDAERLALFQTEEPLEFTLESDFSSVNKDRDPESTKQFPATAKVVDASGNAVSVPMQISARGHVRRMSITCGFVPLRLQFTKDAVKGTVFEGRADSLKLVTHCQNGKDSDQYILREYLGYQLSNIFLPRSFRARLSTVTYVDSKNGKTLTTRYGILLEDDGDVARRMGGRTVSLERVVFADLPLDPLMDMMVFEFMMGNTDYSIFALHNVVLIQTPDKKLYPVPYDWDLSGFVHTPYASPDKRLGMTSVTDRLYRGPCRTPEQLQPVFERFLAKKAEVMQTVQELTGLNPPVRQEIKQYLEDFYSILGRSSGVKRYFIDHCNKTAM
jgi:hypothetical protein